LLVLGGVAVAIYFSASEEVFQGHIVEINGLIGSEKSDFFDNPRLPVTSLKPRLLLYLYGASHIGGSSLALLGLGLYFAGVIKSFWYLIVAGLYVAGVFLVPAGREHSLKFHREAKVSEIRKALEHLLIHPVRDGKTSKELFLEQLAVLNADMKQVVEDVNRDRVNTLEAHGRFLRSYFGHSDKFIV
jgi:hypothetical protein